VREPVPPARRNLEEPWARAPAGAAGGAPRLTVSCADGWLIASFAAPVRACSWAIVGGGIVETAQVAWLEVKDHELDPTVDPLVFLETRLRARGLAGAVGLLTGRRLSAHLDVGVARNGVRARCVATVGLGNALAAGDPAGVAAPPGTINLLVDVDLPLSDEALLEASAVATEAKCAAMIGAGVRSRLTGRPATGTGTDCIVVTGHGRSARSAPVVTYAGKHTAIGAAVGEVVTVAVSRGIADWLREHTLEGSGVAP
jgi:adenosylcobinamide amidohydrolase